MAQTVIMADMGIPILIATDMDTGTDTGITMAVNLPVRNRG